MSCDVRDEDTAKAAVAHNTGSGICLTGLPGLAGYTAAKGAIGQGLRRSGGRRSSVMGRVERIAAKFGDAFRAGGNADAVGNLTIGTPAI